MAIRAKKKKKKEIDSLSVEGCQALFFTTHSIRRQTEDFFGKGIHSQIDPHNPFLVMEIKEGVLEVTARNNPLNILNHPDYALVIRRWPGKARSDYFRFTVGQLRTFLATQK